MLIQNCEQLNRRLDEMVCVRWQYGLLLLLFAPFVKSNTENHIKSTRKKNIHQNQNQSDCVIEALSAALPFNIHININISV